MRELMLAVVLLGAGLAGCVGVDDAPLDNVTDAGHDIDTSVPTFPNGTPAPTSVAVRDCYEQGGALPVPASAYEDRLPEGFSLVPFGSTVAAAEPTGRTAELEVLGQMCTLPDGSSVTRVFSYLMVDPPDAWEASDVTFGYGLVLGYVTTSDRQAAVHQAWGFGDVAQAGEVTFDVTQTPAARTGSIQVSADDVSLELDTAVEGPPTVLEGQTIRWFALGEDGNVTGAKDGNWTSIQLNVGQVTASGSGAFGTLDGLPAQPGLGIHVSGFDETHRYVDLPPREEG